ncbi:MAG: tRNA (N6-isopentenyl adenosine(37)-C2)-methylthiotransferase MiaB [Gemmatimonadales bacterium]|jgi:tRNA-2-methylthio-N6-dimethylallyladenosine synthase
MAERLIELRRAGSGAGVAESAGSAAAATPRPLTRRAFIETYGCQMNLGDSELMAGVLAERGYVTVDDPSVADVIIVNTCAIREHAEQRVRGRIGQLQRHREANPELVLAVTGCMAQRLGGDLLASTSGVDVVAGPDAYRDIGRMIDDIRLGDVARGQLLLALDADENYEDLATVRREGVTAWVTVQRGCDHRCTFCIVPYVRGPEKNREPAAVLAEVADAVEAGFTEVTLLGQTVNSYRLGDWDFARLLRAVARVEGVRRVRFTSPHPNDVTRGLIEVIASEPAVCPQLHLPVQSGSDRMLKRMVRRYTTAEFLETVERVRAGVPGIALSTDVIVGFPGETEEDFEATLELMRRVRFDDAFMYRYSPRDGTPATRLPAGDFVDEDVSGERLERLIGLHRDIQREIARSEIGQVREVLIEREARSDGDVLGRTPHNKVVAFPGELAEVGRYERVRLVSTSGATFRGERVA